MMIEEKNWFCRWCFSYQY